MKEVWIDISSQYSKTIDEIKDVKPVKVYRFVRDEIQKKIYDLSKRLQNV